MSSKRNTSWLIPDEACCRGGTYCCLQLSKAQICTWTDLERLSFLHPWVERESSSLFISFLKGFGFIWINLLMMVVANIPPLKTLSPDSASSFLIFKTMFPTEFSQKSDTNFPETSSGSGPWWKGRTPAALLGTGPVLTKLIHHSRSLPFSHAAWVGNGSGLLTEHCLRTVWSKANRERKIHSWHQSY